MDNFRGVIRNVRVNSRDDLHRLIEENDAWGMPFEDFEAKVCNFEQDGTPYHGQLEWGYGGVYVRDEYSLIQYIHRHYKPL